MAEIDRRGQTKYRPVKEKRAPVRAGEGYLYSAAQVLLSAAAPANIDVGAGGTGVAGSETRLFSVAQGGEGQNFNAGIPLRNSETNLKNAGRIPDEQSFRMRSVGFFFYAHMGGVLADQTSATAVVTDNAQAALLKTGAWEFDSPQWKYTWGPSDFWPAGIGIEESGIAGNGQRTVTARIKLRRAVILRAGQTFAMIWRIERTTRIALADQVANQRIAVMSFLYGDWLEKVG